MKKIIAPMLIGILAISTLVGCSINNTEKEPSSENTTSNALAYDDSIESNVKDDVVGYWMSEDDDKYAILSVIKQEEYLDDADLSHALVCFAAYDNIAMDKAALYNNENILLDNDIILNYTIADDVVTLIVDNKQYTLSKTEQTKFDNIKETITFKTFGTTENKNDSTTTIEIDLEAETQNIDLEQQEQDN